MQSVTKMLCKDEEIYANDWLIHESLVVLP